MIFIYAPTFNAAVSIVREFRIKGPHDYINESRTFRIISADFPTVLIRECVSMPKEMSEMLETRHANVIRLICAIEHLPCPGGHTR